MNLSPRDRLIAVIAACVVGVLVLFFVLVYPQIGKLGPLDAQIAAAQSSAQAAKLKLAQRQGFRDRAIENNAKWLRLMNQVPDNPDLASLIIELQDTAFKSGVQVVTVSPAQPANKGAFSAITVNIEILGSWTDTIDYMQALMNLDRGVRVVNLQTALTTAAGTEDVRDISLPRYAVRSTLNLETYLIPSSVATGAPNAAVPAK